MIGAVNIQDFVLWFCLQSVILTALKVKWTSTDDAEVYLMIHDVFKSNFFNGVVFGEEEGSWQLIYNASSYGTKGEHSEN